MHHFVTPHAKAPFVTTNPTGTVFEAMKRSCAIAEAMNQDHVIITADQAVYEKAQEIRWKHTDLFRTVILQLGAFHTCTAFMAVLGKQA